MIKSAKEILLEKGIDIDKIRREKEDSKRKSTVALVEFVTDWFAEHEPGTVLKIGYAGGEYPARGFSLTSAKEVDYKGNDVTVHTLNYDANRFNDPCDMLEALGFYVYWPYSPENRREWRRDFHEDMKYDPYKRVSLPTA